MIQTQAAAPPTLFAASFPNNIPLGPLKDSTSEQRQPWKAVVAVAATEPALPQVALEAGAVSAAMPPAARPQHQQHLPPQPLQQPQDWNSAHEPAALPAGWRQAVAPDGRTYYENDITKVTQWDHPAAAAAEDNLPLQLPSQQPMAAAVMH